jgi:hypothetical protein
MKKIIAVVIFAAVLAGGFLGLIVPRRMLNTFYMATANRDNC